MATRFKVRTSDLYEQDIYAWSKAQADLLRAKRFAELDLEHPIEEIDDVGGNLYREVRSRVRTIMEHLLKLEHSPAAEPRAGWETTIRMQRADLAEDLTPSLRPRVEQTLPRFYEMRGSKLRRCCATTAKTRPPTRHPRPARIPSTGSPAIGARPVAWRCSMATRFGDALCWPEIDKDLDVCGFLIGAEASGAKPPVEA